MKLPGSTRYLVFIGNLATVAITLLGFLIQAISGTADFIQLISSGMSIAAVILLIMVNIIIVWFVSLRKDESQGQPHLSKTQARLQHNLALQAQKKQSVFYKKASIALLCIVVLQLILLVIVMVSSSFGPPRYDYDEVVSELIETRKDKELLSVPTYKPRFPEAGATINLWEPFDPTENRAGSILPPSLTNWGLGISFDGLSRSSRVTGIMVDPDNPANLVLLMIPEDALPGISFDFGGIVNSYTIQTKVKVMTQGGRGKDVPDYEIWADGKWHTWELVFQFGETQLYIDGIPFQNEGVLPIGMGLLAAGLQFVPGDMVLLDDITVWSTP